MQRYRLIVSTLFFVCQLTVGQVAPTNIRIYPSSVTQTEPVIAVSLINPQLLFASSRTINTTNGFQSEGVYVSTDGGLSWRGTDTCRGQSITNHAGDPGVMIHSSGRFVLTHIGSSFPGVYSHYSADMGQTWSNAYTISSDLPEDKGSVEIDNTPASPFYGRMYSAWVRLISPYPVSFSYSSDAGTSWSPVSVINGTPPLRCSGGTIATGIDGKVYVTWAGMTSSNPAIEDFAGFAASTNGGVSWSVQQNIFDMNGINGNFPAKGNIRVNGLPQIAIDNSSGPRSGWLYIVTTEKDISPAGADPDIVLHRSTNGGLNWSSGIRVNKDVMSNGKTQYFPAIDVDENGGVNILYYDDRFTANDSTGVILSRSTDGGTNWTETVVASHTFKPKAIIGGSSNYQGDHIALKAAGNKLHAFWMDDFSGIYQIWLATIPIGSSAVKELDAGIPATSMLHQNYPNPFNPNTTIRFAIRNSAHVSLKVFDVLGKEVATLVDERLEAGSYESAFEADGLSSGVYFYRLVAGNFVQTKKLVLAR